VTNHRRPTISLAAATGLVEAIDAAGGDPDGVLRMVGLERRDLAGPHGFIGSLDFARILEEAARATGDACFGLHFGERFQPKDAGALVFVVLNAPTFAVAFADLARFLKLYNEAAEASFVAGPTRSFLGYRLHLPAALRRQHVEYGVALGLGIIRRMAGSGWAPLEVQFEHAAPPDPAEHARVFGAPVSFGGGANVMFVEPDLGDFRVPAADTRLYPILRRYLERDLAEMPPEEGVLASVRRAITESMRHGDPKLGEVARRIAMGPRTLQRQLREHGLDFKNLVDETRRELSLRYLRDRRNTLTDVSYLVGYSEVSAFNRAFRRWTGATPSGYRRELTRR
jgi:AraC-like DNA-binding protein